MENTQYTLLVEHAIRINENNIKPTLTQTITRLLKVFTATNNTRAHIALSRCNFEH